ncbi:hypothetical protein HAX54_028615, partial [Datura stramonium]|nr:hypothetical protein [Datura stramonium]
MAEHRWSNKGISSRKNCIGVALGGTSRMTVPKNSTVLRAAMVVDPAESIQRFKPDCRKWAIRVISVIILIKLRLGLYHVLGLVDMLRFESRRVWMSLRQEHNCCIAVDRDNYWRRVLDFRIRFGGGFSPKIW